MKKLFIFIVFSVGFLLLPGTIFADSITPDTYSATLDVGESVTITKTVTVDYEPAGTTPLDVFFLTDATGSMYWEIAAVQDAATTIMNNTSALGDVHFGAGEYRDFGDYEEFDYRRNHTITNDISAVQTGIDAWEAWGGGDLPEANLYALNEVATDAGWRDDARKMIVWFGDAPGHDPSGGVTEEAATAALQSAGISVEAIDVGYLDEDDWLVTSLDDTGQASRIAAATGGNYYSGIETDSLVDTIEDAIETAFFEYSSVALDLSAVPEGLTVTSSPPSFLGEYDREVARDFEFDVTFMGDAAGTYEFLIAARVDGGVVAREYDTITVGGGTEPVPEPATAILFGSALLAAGGLNFLRKKRFSA